jgi:hypothetical protein
MPATVSALEVDTARRRLGAAGAICGIIGAAGNVLGVVVLTHIPSAYRPGSLPAWAREIMAAPGEAAASGVAFTLGLLALAGWALILGSRLGTPGARTAGAIIAIGATLDAAFTPAAVVVGWHLGPACRAASTDCLPASVALLGMSLSLDALFNLALGLGLILIAPALWRRAGAPRWLAVLSCAAGAASLPVSFQVYSDTAAKLLGLAAPLWLLTVLASSVLLYRDRV